MIDTILGQLNEIFKALRMAKVFVFGKGALENYYSAPLANPYAVSQDMKDRLFSSERERILLSDHIAIEKDYIGLIEILNDTFPTSVINVLAHINFALKKWMFDVQLAYHDDKARTLDDLRKNPHIEFEVHEKLFEISSFVADERGFKCVIKLKKSVSISEKEVTFTNKTIPSEPLLDSLE